MTSHLTGTATYPGTMEASTPAVVKSPAKATLTSRLPSLDGWRGLSILAVLGSHTKDVVGFPM